ncbi:adenylate/guanylate cyclase domain-containing protein [Mycolicibacterium agri]|uniref:Adenylate/guanylate cyclase domain-containing protein n=1 Tax=Mycolicibacterium agri TaxID=36811 RepID=A0A2A7NCA7_MYCAG|nr:alpha/beta fold hydrolase [Mycolicibacterium agri]PEG41413.1 adenylate/guanylate cyclase domain-containing protein [Mycolicibacterium agri]GFG52996.1 hydrolase [Mycolicibacterium agri]
MGDGRVRYVRNGDVRLAYRVYGDSEPTLVWVPTVFSSIDRYDDPAFPWCVAVQRLSQQLRVAVYDGRGTGLSDPVLRAPTLDDRVNDLVCVIDAVGAQQPILLGLFTGGMTALALATRHADRLRSLFLYATAARFTQAPDFPWGFTGRQVEQYLHEIDERWGEGAFADLVFGESAQVPGVREQWGRVESSLASPAMAALLWRAYLAEDVRDVIGRVAVPTVVAARPGDHMVPYEASVALANGIPGAELLTLPPGEHHAFDIVDLLIEKLLNFCESPCAATNERILATVLFTDIVSSTEQLSASGDEYWRHQLDVHDGIVDALLTKHGGRRANHTGDGVFALFDVPSRAARCALELVPTLASRGLRIRAGLHVGECEHRGDEWSGLAVHTGARVCSMAGAAEILCTRTVHDLAAGSGVVFESVGPQAFKGLPEVIDVYRVTAG